MKINAKDTMTNQSDALAYDTGGSDVFVPPCRKTIERIIVISRARRSEISDVFMKNVNHERTTRNIDGM